MRAQFRNHRACDSLSERSDVMQRYDDRIRRGAGGGNERKEVCCRNCTHVSNFPSSSSFEQGKKVPSRNDGFPAVGRPWTARKPSLLGCPCLRFPESLVRPET